MKVPNTKPSASGGGVRAMQCEILVVDDEHSILDTVGSGLEEEGYRVTTIDNRKAAIEAVAKNHFDLVITDLAMDEPDGMEVLTQVRGHKKIIL